MPWGNQALSAGFAGRVVARRTVHRSCHTLTQQLHEKWQACALFQHGLSTKAVAEALAGDASRRRPSDHSTC